MQSEPPTKPPSPTRWAASGVLGGASIVGMLWAITGRAPTVLNAQPIREPIAAASFQPANESIQSPRADRPSEAAVIAPEPITSRPAEISSPEVTPDATRRAEPLDALPSPSPASVPAAVLTERININTASAATLDLLPRIGPGLAARIIAFREAEGPIRSLTHLADVKGIGIKTIEQVERYIRFD